MTGSVSFLALLLFLVCAVPTHAEEVAISSKGPSATVIEKRESNTRSALIVAQVTKVGAYEYCRRDPDAITKAYGGQLTLDECVAAAIKEYGSKPLVARADCQAGVIMSISGLALKGVGLDEFGSVLWKDILTGKTEGHCGACQGTEAESQYKSMCGAEWKQGLSAALNSAPSQSSIDISSGKGMLELKAIVQNSIGQDGGLSVTRGYCHSGSGYSIRSMSTCDKIRYDMCNAEIGECGFNEIYERDGRLMFNIDGLHEPYSNQFGAVDKSGECYEPSVRDGRIFCFTQLPHLER